VHRGAGRVLRSFSVVAIASPLQKLKRSESTPRVLTGILADHARPGLCSCPLPWHQCTPPEFAKYLRWAIAEIAETQTHLRNGEAKRYFSEEQVEPVWRISKRTMKATTRLLKSKLAQIEAQKRAKRTRRRHY
jgi:hypothetical protein